MRSQTDGVPRGGRTRGSLMRHAARSAAQTNPRGVGQGEHVMDFQHSIGRRLIAQSGSRSVVCAVIALTVAQLLWFSGAQAKVRHTIIAASGAAAPAGGQYVGFFSNPSSNARGQVAFDAFLGGPSNSGVFVSDGRRTSVIALGGDPDPAAGNFNFVFAPSITTRGTSSSTRWMPFSAATAGEPFRSCRTATRHR